MQLQMHQQQCRTAAARRLPATHHVRPTGLRLTGRVQAADVEISSQVAQLNSQLEALRNENARLKSELLKLRSQQARTQGVPARGPPPGVQQTPSIGAVAAAVVADPLTVPPPDAEPPETGAAAYVKLVERGVSWPTPGTKFWERQPRLAPMPVDIGKGQQVIPPRDSRSLEIVHFTAELAPIAKVGGLGDVVTGLARTCLARGHQVKVCMPFYEALPQEQIDNLQHEMDIEVPKGYFWDGEMQTGSILTSVWRGVIAGVPVVLIRPADWNACNLFRGSRIYGGSYNELEAYLYFCRAGLEYLRASNQQPHVLHLHEWQTCAASMLYWEVFVNEGLYRPRVVLTIHNLDNTGECRQEEFAFTGMNGEMFATIERALDERTIGHNPERLNLMKGGLVYSNAVTTVSPSYAQEMLTGGAAGWLRATVSRPEIKTKVRGILNGIDTSEWNPSEDPLLPANFNAQFPDGKAVCKRYLQRGLGMAESNKPLVAVITRLVPQKGIPLIKAALYRTLELGGQFVLLGSGHCDGDFKKLAATDFANSPDCKLLIMYSEALAHQIYGAADVVLVPSMFEPCGLTQMIGMRYGAVPVVRKTGGLADTVRDVDSAAPGQGNGYTFDGTDERSLHGALDRALAHYKERPDSWRDLALCNMNTELSWGRSASDYVALYNSVAMP